MADDGRAVFGFGEGFEDGEVDGGLGGFAAGRVEEGLEFLASRVGGDVVAGDAGEAAEVGHVVGGWIGVDAADHREVESVEEGGGGLIGFDHEHLDEGVGEGVVFGLGIYNVPCVVVDEFDFGEAEDDHTVAEAPLADAFGQVVHGLEHLDEGSWVLGFGFTVFGGFADIAIDDGLSFEIGEAFGGMDAGFGEACGDDVGVFIVADEAGEAAAGNVFLEGADAVAQDLGKHGDDVAWEVDGVAAGVGFLVDLGAGFDVEGNVGDVNGEFDHGAGSVVDFGHGDGVIEVAGVGGVDGADQGVGEVESVWVFLFGVEFLDGFAGVFEDGFGELAWEPESLDGGEGFDFGDAGFA